MVKICSKCDKELSVKEFSKRNNAKSGLRSWCKSCDKESRKIYKRPKQTYYSRLKTITNAETFRLKIRNQTLKSKYGINVDDYEELFKSQQGKCAICNKIEKLYVDHNHFSGKVRGLLCSRCNSCLERIELDPDWGTKAVSYLSRHVDEDTLQINTNTAYV